MFVFSFLYVVRLQQLYLELDPKKLGYHFKFLTKVALKVPQVLSRASSRKEYLIGVIILPVQFIISAAVKSRAE